MRLTSRSCEDQEQNENKNAIPNQARNRCPCLHVPSYSVHALGVQANFILPAKDLALFFKYYDEYRAMARPQGRTFVFGGSWTFRIPKSRAANP
jgi:hypothetical protein